MTIKYWFTCQIECSNSKCDEACEDHAIGRGPNLRREATERAIAQGWKKMGNDYILCPACFEKIHRLKF